VKYKSLKRREDGQIIKKIVITLRIKLKIYLHSSHKNPQDLEGEEDRHLKCNKAVVVNIKERKKKFKIKEDKNLTMK